MPYPNTGILARWTVNGGARIAIAPLLNTMNFIKGAIKHPGAFTAQAKAAGMGTQAFAAKVTAPGSKASSTTKRRANLAKTLVKLRKRH